jgi:uncharacterized protein (TIGR00661 family)
MVKIVYGVSGEGSGHSSRAREMASHLRERGHDLWLVSYDRGYRNLKDEFRVLEVEGPCIASEDNKVSVVKTFTENLKRLPAGHRTLQDLRRKLFKDFQPDCVITDFEPMTAYLATHYELPLITIDNQHRMRYLQYTCPPGLEFDSEMTRSIIRAMVPRPDVSLVTAFHAGDARNNRTFVFPPIVRREVQRLQPSVHEHTLVYVTSGFESLLTELRKFERETFLVYGYDCSDREGPLQFKPFSKEGFLHDLAGAKGVIATAGFTLISEALYLRKPYLALPMQGQFEQELNAFQLAELGFGKNAPEITGETIGDFLYRLSDYRTCLADYTASDNSEIKAKLDELLADDCFLAKQFRDNRK